MSRVSTRYAPHLLGLIALVSVPAYLHATGRSYQDDCANPAGLNEDFDFGTANPLVQREERLNPNVIQWTEGVIDLDPGSGLEVEFALARSFRPANLYLGLSKLRPGFIEPEEITIGTVEADGVEGEYRLLIAADHHPIRIAAFMTIYDHAASPSPFSAQVARAIPELFSTLSPMTMFFVFAEVPRPERDRVEDFAQAWLTSAWQQYRAACVR